MAMAMSEMPDGEVHGVQRSGDGAGHAYETAVNTVHELKDLINNESWENANQLIDILSKHGRRLQEAAPSQVVIGNMVRRALFIIRDEHDRATRGRGEESESLQGLLSGRAGPVPLSEQVPSLKGSIMEALQELMSELESCGENIAAQAPEHIHSNEVIMTLGHCRTVESFLLRAAKKRKFQVMVVESAPDCRGHELATRLADQGIDTTLLSDAAACAIMARINKVIVGTAAVLADGGLRARAGTHALALAARHHAIPVLVCAAMYKLTMLFRAAHDQPGFHHSGGPQPVLNTPLVVTSPAPPRNAGRARSTAAPSVHVLNPDYDYVPPELVTLLISNLGGHSPSYVYRLLKELYNSNDTLT